MKKYFALLFVLNLAAQESSTSLTMDKQTFSKENMDGAVTIPTESTLDQLIALTGSLFSCCSPSDNYSSQSCTISSSRRQGPRARYLPRWVVRNIADKDRDE